MIRRIFTLALYLLRVLLFSWTGLLYVIAALVYWLLFFDGETPEFAYFVLVIGGFGAVTTFLITLSVAARAHRSEHTAWLVRLPSRVEYLAAVLGASLALALTIQVLIALLTIRGGLNFPLRQAVEIPPVWLSVNILIAVLALHATDLVTAGWSRVGVYGLLLVLLFGQNGADNVTRWASSRLIVAATYFRRQGLSSLGDPLQGAGSWLSSDGHNTLEQILGLVFWPFRAISEAIAGGAFDNTRALAPAFLLLYATILFLLAADFFATKDLQLSD